MTKKIIIITVLMIPASQLFAVEAMRQVSASGITHSFLICGKKTQIIGEDSQVIWDANCSSRDGYVLNNGNILFSSGKVAKEMTRDHQVVWSYTLSRGNKELGTAQRLANDHTLIVERGPTPQLLEITKEGKVAVTVPLKPDTTNAHMQTRMARKLSDGNYIVPHLLGFAIKIYKPDGTVIRTIKTDLEELGGRKAKNWPFTAIVLPNGNILANLTNGEKTVEFDKEGKAVWIVTNKDLGGKYFRDPCGGQRLPNGNTIISSYGQRNAKMVRVFEVTPDKKVVWEFYHPHTSGHGIHVISTNGKPLRNNKMK